MRFIWRVLTFQFSAEDISGTRASHLVLGLLFTWAAGIGRYWDNPRASVPQQLGLGSIGWFLAIVAAWRVALYITFLRRYAEMRTLRWFVAAVLPLGLIVFALAALNLERAVFEIMAGNNPSPGTPADGAYAVLILLTLVSFYVTPFVAIAYLFAIYQARKARVISG